MGTTATISAANPESIYFSETVTPPLPPRTKQAPIIKDVRQFAQFDLPMPCNHAIPYMITPAIRNRVPAIKNGGTVSIAKRIPREVEPQIRYRAAKATIIRIFVGAAMKQ